MFCSDLTFSATVNPVSYEGGEQVFIDSERETWNMDPRALERAFEPVSYTHLQSAVRTKGIYLCEGRNACVFLFFNDVTSVPRKRGPAFQTKSFRERAVPKSALDVITILG